MSAREGPATGQQAERAPSGVRGTSGRIVAVAALIVTLLVAGVVSYYASGSPDGLEKVSVEQGFDGTARDSAAADSPMADYSTLGVADERLSGGLAGVVGVLVVLAVAGLLFWVLRRRARAGDASGRSSPTSATGP